VKHQKHINCFSPTTIFVEISHHKFFVFVLRAESREQEGESREQEEERREDRAWSRKKREGSIRAWSIDDTYSICI